MPNDFDRRFENHRKDFNKKFGLFNTIFIIVFVLITALSILQLAAYTYIAVKGIEVLQEADPKDVARGLGELVKSYNEGASNDHGK